MLDYEKTYYELRNKQDASFKKYVQQPTKENKEEWETYLYTFQSVCATILDKLVEENADILKRLKEGR